MLELSAYPSTGQLRIYDIEAISLPVVYNRFGDHDPNGLLLRPQGGHRKGGHAGGLSGQGRERLHPTGAADHSRQRRGCGIGHVGHNSRAEPQHTLSLRERLPQPEAMVGKKMLIR